MSGQAELVAMDRYDTGMFTITDVATELNRSYRTTTIAVNALARIMPVAVRGRQKLLSQQQLDVLKRAAIVQRGGADWRTAISQVLINGRLQRTVTSVEALGTVERALLAIDQLERTVQGPSSAELVLALRTLVLYLQAHLLTAPTTSLSTDAQTLWRLNDGIIRLALQIGHIDRRLLHVAHALQNSDPSAGDLSALLQRTWADEPLPHPVDWLTAAPLVVHTTGEPFAPAPTDQGAADDSRVIHREMIGITTEDPSFSISHSSQRRGPYRPFRTVPPRLMGRRLSWPQRSASNPPAIPPIRPSEAYPAQVPATQQQQLLRKFRKSCRHGKLLRFITTASYSDIILLRDITMKQSLNAISVEAALNDLCEIVNTKPDDFNEQRIFFKRELRKKRLRIIASEINRIFGVLSIETDTSTNLTGRK